MLTTLFFTTLYISQYVCENFSDLVLPNENESTESDSYKNVDASIRFPEGIVAYRIDENSYDTIISNRIRTAMDLIEASSCVVFKPIIAPIQSVTGSWIHFTNPYDIRECVHVPGFGDEGEIIIVLGFECLTSRYVLHAVLHGIGFKDEVSHPQREQYIRIIWQNIQPRYRDLFAVQQQDPQYKMVEYDPMSVMHFHDRAFSLNGGPTIAPRVPGLHIKPSSKLSQLDVMKLRMWFGHECNKRKVGAVLEKCKTVLHTGQNLQGPGDDFSVNVDDLQNPYNMNGPGDPQIDEDVNEENGGDGDAENVAGGDADNGGGGDADNGDVGDAEYGDVGDAEYGGDGDEANGGDGDEANGGDGDEANEGDGDAENGGDGDEGNGDDGNEDNRGNNDEMNEVDNETNADGGMRDDGIVMVKNDEEGPVA